MGDLLEYITPSKQEFVKTLEYDEKKYVHGIDGIAELLGCSKTMVGKYRRDGWIEPAIKQMGRKIVCDAPLALELFGKRK
ncbi:MAG: DUF3853 family protein [Flavobacteriaceae bacterium]|nr:DUF3853 family protein [Flavobacteriaceae bacterium]